MGLDISSGAAGVIVGFGVKFLSDWWTTNRTEKRDDLVWRRERLSEASAALMKACVDATKASGWVVRCAEELGNLEQQHSPDPNWLQSFRQRLAEAQEEYRLRAEDVDRALPVVLLYSGSAQVRDAAEDLVRVTKENPSMQEVIGGPFHNQVSADAFLKVVLAATS